MASQLAPGFLVAAPSLLDPNFKRTVVLLVDHRPEGSLGLRGQPARAGAAARDARTARAGDRRRAAIPDSSVLVGGPVAPQTGWIVFEQGRRHGRQPRTSCVSRIGSRSARRASCCETLVAHKGPERMLLVLGYSGWGPGQLDAEIAQGAWIPVDFDERIVFDTPFEDRWASALRILGHRSRAAEPDPAVRELSSPERRLTCRAGAGRRVGAGVVGRWQAGFDRPLPAAACGKTTRPKRSSVWKSPISGGDQPTARWPLLARVHHEEVHAPGRARPRAAPPAWRPRRTRSTGSRARRVALVFVVVVERALERDLGVACARPTPRRRTAAAGARVS